MTLHLVRLEIDSQKLYRFAREARLPSRDFDEGYAVHALLAALFDHRATPTDRVAPKPFMLPDPSRRNIELLGYTRIEGAALAGRAEQFGDPRAWGVIDLSQLRSKPMPGSFPVRARLGFDVRVCPVKRVAQRGNQRKARAEVDVFLARAWEVNDPDVKLDREDTYRAWLAAELKKQGAKLLSSSMKSFQLGRQHRKTQGDEREGRRVSHPEAQFSGEIEIEDPTLFTAGLSRGLGRHRTFGFGMLLLKPAPPQ